MFGRAKCNSCQSVRFAKVSTLLSWARKHHDKYDHPPFKESTEPDKHNLFSLTTGGVQYEICASSMFVRLFEGDRMLYLEKYNPSGERRV